MKVNEVKETREVVVKTEYIAILLPNIKEACF